MIVVAPIKLGDAQLLQSNAPAFAAWVAETTYAVDARVVKSGAEYRSLASANKGRDPETSPDWWYPLGTTNRLAAFDVSPRSQCIGPAAGPLVIKIRPGQRVTTLGLLNLSASSMHVNIVDAIDGEELHDDEYPLATSAGTYWSWFFEPLKQKRDLVITGLVPSTQAVITLTFTPLFGNPAAVGVIGVGRDQYVGDATYGFQGGIQLRGKSYIDANDNPVRPERGHSRTLSGAVEVARLDVNRVMQYLTELIGVPAIWVLDEDTDDYASMVVYGDFERVAARIDNREITTFSYDLNGYQ